MSDRIPAEIWIGGKIAVSLVPGLCAEITDEGVSLEWGATRVDPSGPDDLTAAIKADNQGVRLLWFCDEEASCGEFDVLESFLQAHDIPFTRRTDGRYEYDPVKVEFRPGTEQVDLAIDRSGETVVPASPLIAVEAILTKALQLAQSGEAKRAMTAVRTARKKLRQVLPPPVPSLPPFEIVLDGSD
jgi:hypothetical protein